MSEKEKCKFCKEDMNWVAGGEVFSKMNATYIKSKCSKCKAEYTIEKTWTKEVDRILEKPVKNRSEEDHQILIKHFGGVRKYLLSMGAFKEVNID